MPRRAESKDGKREVMSCRVSPETEKKLKVLLKKRKKENIKFNLGRLIDEIVLEYGEK